MNTKSAAPKVFISYSHDDDRHKEWVRSLAKGLRLKGIDTILDQWTGLGEDLTVSMESIENSDRVVVVCTEKYVARFDGRQGGVGYEAGMVTAELLERYETNKFIPVIRQLPGDGKGPARPGALRTRKYIDMSSDDDFEIKLDELAREIHKAPKDPIPSIGPNPYATTDSQPSTVRNDDPWDVFRRAQSLVNRNDIVELRRLATSLGQRAEAESMALSKKWAPLIQSGSNRTSLEREGLVVYVPLISYVMSAAQSQLRRTLIGLAVDEIMPTNPGGGYVILVHNYETALHYLQALVGSYAMHLQDVAGAVEVADSLVKDTAYDRTDELWEIAVESGTSKAAPFNSYRRLIEWFPWLENIYGSIDEFTQAMYAYLMLRNVYFFVADQKRSDTHYPHFAATPLKLDGNAPGILRKAYRLLIASPIDIANIWRRRDLSDEQVKNGWPIWINKNKKILDYPRHISLPYENLMDDIFRAI